MINLNANEERVLRLLEENTSTHGEMCCSFKHLADDKEDIKFIRRGCRSLRRKGLAEFYRGLMNEDGEVAGSGYCIHPEGIEWINKKNTVTQPLAI